MRQVTNWQPHWDAALSLHRDRLAAGCIPVVGAMRIGSAKAKNERDDNPTDATASDAEGDNDA